MRSEIDENQGVVGRVEETLGRNRSGFDRHGELSFLFGMITFLTQYFRLHHLRARMMLSYLGMGFAAGDRSAPGVWLWPYAFCQPDGSAIIDTALPLGFIENRIIKALLLITIGPFGVLVVIGLRTARRTVQR